MEAGKLDRRISLQRAVTARDAAGQMVPAWWPLGPDKIWASWRRATARETQAAAENSAIVTDVFEIRFASEWADLNPKDRLIYRDKPYEIAEVAEIGRREGFRIGASARADR